MLAKADIIILGLQVLMFCVSTYRVGEFRPVPSHRWALFLFVFLSFGKTPTH